MLKKIIEQIKIEYHFWKIRRMMRQIERENNAIS